MNKRKLLERARAGVRTPNPARLARPVKRGYAVVSVSLYTDQATAVDGLVAQLEAGGYPKANRSFVVQEAILTLLDRLRADGAERPDGVAAWFHDQARRRRRE